MENARMHTSRQPMPATAHAGARLLGPGALALMALTLVPAEAEAGSMTMQGPAFMIGGGIGYNRIESEDFPNDDDDLSDSHVSYKGIAGVRFSESFSLEGQYINFGTAEDGNNRVEATGWTAGAVLKLPVTDWFHPYGKAGALFWDADGRSGDPGGPTINASDDGTDFTYGVGAEFMLAPPLALRTEYERFELSDTGVDMGSASILFRF